MPHGRSWKVLKPSMFESLVMPLFFEYSNYHSFNRLVNAWSFRRISSGPDRGSYYHEVRVLLISYNLASTSFFEETIYAHTFCHRFSSVVLRSSSFVASLISKSICVACPRHIRSSP
jgi:hypothetical protein